MAPRQARSPEPAGRRPRFERRVHLQVINRTRSPLPPAALLAEAARLALVPLAGRCSRRGLATTLVCVGERRMRALGARFAGCPELTDVLAFPQGETDPDTGRYAVGEVVVCRPVAVRQARARGLSVRGELLLYALHGWLHLAGHRDGTEAQREKMVRAEQRIMKRLGLKRDSGRA